MKKNNLLYSCIIVLITFNLFIPTVRAQTETPTPTDTPTPANPTDTPTPSPTPVPDPSQVFISEVMVNPEDGSEWVEIYNNNESSITLKDWYMDDAENADSLPRKFTLDIAGKSYNSFDIPNTFNNDQDKVRLLDSSQTFKDGFEYSTTEKGKSYGRTSFSSDNFCLQIASRNTTNGSCTNPTSTPTPTPTTATNPTATPTPTPKPNATATPTPTPKKSPTPTIKTASPSAKLTSNATASASIKKLSPSPDILGVKTENNNQLKAKIFAIIAIIFSLLTLFAIFHRMILKHEKSR